jgi:hypothetical protein
MVSLSAVEEALTKALSAASDEPSIAVLARGSEGESRPQLVVFSAVELTPDRANEILDQLYPPIDASMLVAATPPPPPVPPSEEKPIRRRRAKKEEVTAEPGTITEPVTVTEPEELE